MYITWSYFLYIHAPYRNADGCFLFIILFLSHWRSAQVWCYFTANLNFLQVTQLCYPRGFLTSLRYLVPKRDSILLTMKTTFTVWSILPSRAVLKSHWVSSSNTTVFPVLLSTLIHIEVEFGNWNLYHVTCAQAF